MAVVASPGSVIVYPSVSSNPVGSPSAVITLSGDTSYTVSNPQPTVISTSISGSILTVGYIAPQTLATAISLVITGSPSGTSTTVAVSSFGPLQLTNFTPAGSTVGSFTVLEPGYSGVINASVDPPLVTLSIPAGQGPVWASIVVTPVSPGECVVTITDDHGGAVQYLITVTAAATITPALIPIGYPTAGAWFDFQHPDSDGLPTVGQIRGMPVTGAVSLRGPMDTGNFAWCSGITDSVNAFDNGYGDNGYPIQVIWAGKSDFFLEELGQAAPLMLKTVDNVVLLLSITQVSATQQFIFNNIITVDELDLSPSKINELIVGSTASLNAVVGTAIVGQSIIGAGSTQSTFQVTRAFSVQGSQGHVVKVGFREASVSPWTILGYIVRVTAQEETIV